MPAALGVASAEHGAPSGTLAQLCLGAHAPPRAADADVATVAQPPRFLSCLLPCAQRNPRPLATGPCCRKFPDAATLAVASGKGQSFRIPPCGARSRWGADVAGVPAAGMALMAGGATHAACARPIWEVPVALRHAQLPQLCIRLDPAIGPRLGRRSAGTRPPLCRLLEHPRSRAVGPWPCSTMPWPSCDSGGLSMRAPHVEALIGVSVGLDAGIGDACHLIFVVAWAPAPQRRTRDRTTMCGCEAYLLRCPATPAQERLGVQRRAPRHTATYSLRSFRTLPSVAWPTGRGVSSVLRVLSALGSNAPSC